MSPYQFLLSKHFVDQNVPVNASVLSNGKLMICLSTHPGHDPVDFTFRKYLHGQFGPGKELGVLKFSKGDPSWENKLAAFIDE